MSSSNPRLIPISSPWDTWLLAALGESPAERLDKALAAPMPPAPARKLSHEELLELSCRAIDLLSPRFNAAEFHALLQRLGAGPKFTAKAAEKLLTYLCAEPMVELVRPATSKRSAVYHLCRRRRPKRRPQAPAR